MASDRTDMRSLGARVVSTGRGATVFEDLTELGMTAAETRACVGSTVRGSGGDVTAGPVIFSDPAAGTV